MAGLEATRGQTVFPRVSNRASSSANAKGQPPGSWVLCGGPWMGMDDKDGHEWVTGLPLDVPGRPFGFGRLGLWA